MPGYMMPADHGPALRDGRQRVTLAAPRAPQASNAHAELGTTVQLDLAPKGDRPRQRVDQGVCILRASLIIGEFGVIRVVDLRFHERGDHSEQAEKLARIVTNAEVGTAGGGDKAANLALAKLAGFRTWKALWDWNSHRDRRGRPDEHGRVTRELIGWAR